MRISKKQIAESWTRDSLGNSIFLLDPQPQYVFINHIAHSLSLSNRYNGYSVEPYNVAQHSILVASLLPKRLRLRGLLHDGEEAYCQDIVKPFKKFLGSRYVYIAKKWEQAIADRFGYSVKSKTDKKLIKEADNRVCCTEMRDVMWNVYGNFYKEMPYKPMKKKIIPWSARQSEIAFLECFHELTKGQFNI